MACFFSTAVMWGTLYSFGIFFEPILIEFGWSRAATSAAYSFTILLSGFLSIITGKLTDKLGPRLVMTVCGFSLGLGYLLMSQTGFIWQLYVFYGLLIGIGISGAYVPLVSTVGRWFVRRRGMMIGIASAGGSVGAIIMPSLTGWLISLYQWRVSYIITGIIALVITVLSAQFLKRDPGQIGQSPYGGEQVTKDKINWEAGSFSLQEAAHTWQLWLLCTIFAFNLFPLSAIVVHATIHATGLGISATSATYIIPSTGMGGIAGKVILASAGDRIGNKTALIIGFVIMAASLLWFMAAKEIWMFYLSGIAFGFAAQGLIALSAPMAAELFGLGSLGVLFGVVNSIGAIGEASGPVLTGRIFDVTGSYYWAFLICTSLSILGIILTALLKPTSNKGGEK
ncbi:MFS transporter [Chloroflexota bacterium]